jgi:hypothetical protein
MDKRLELIDALLAMGRHCKYVAKLLSAEVVGEVKPEPILVPAGDDTRQIAHPGNYPGWPRSDHRPIRERVRTDTAQLPPLAGLRVLEFSAGSSWPVSVYHTDAKVDLIVNDYKFQEPLQPLNTRIIGSCNEAGLNYDVGVVWESLELVPDPLVVLAELKARCAKIILRVRPWSSRNGAFLNDLAFVHLARPVDHQVQFKVVRPMATYESLFTRLGLTVHERRVHSITVDEFFAANSDVLEVIIERTWGKIDPQEALRIMATDHIDYVVGG